jgi:asparagine synthase (glutamine-hydrolysing)
MCGICGFSGPPDDHRLHAMARLMTHRGPDREGVHQDPGGKMNLAHRRLSIIDLDGGDQPMCNEDRSLWITFNGEIYNYKELQPDLVARGHTLGTASDTETIIHLYEEKGLDLFNSLNGMFAFALWDAKAGRLVLARDRLGVKPLYWAMIDGRLAFASEMSPLLAWPEFERRMDPWAASLYLTLRNIPEPRTIYQGIQALPPAHYLVWEPGREPVIRRYWDLDFTPGDVPDEDALCDELEALLMDATKLRMRSDVPVGAYLSGGVDSSLAVALVRAFHSGRLHTFSLGYAGELPGKNDAHYARMLAKLYGTTHHEHTMDAPELAALLPDVAKHLEQPFSGVISTYFLTGLVSEHVKVVLSGDGADDLFGSYGHHRLAWPLHHLAEARARGGVDPYASVDLGPLRDRPEYVRQFEGLPPWEVRSRFGAFPDDDKRAILSGDFKAWVDEYSGPSFLHGMWEKTTARDPLSAMLEVDVHTLLPNEILFFVDRLSMAHSVEVRSPYLDYRVAELAARVPGSLKIKGDVLKYILRKTAARHLPKEILERPKEGFVLPNHIWLKGALDPLLEDLLSPGELDRSKLFDTVQVARIVREHQTGERDHAFRIWTLVMFQIWHRTFMETPSWPAPIA